MGGVAKMAVGGRDFRVIGDAAAIACPAARRHDELAVHHPIGIRRGGAIAFF